jgi:hypothetical protein
MNDRVRIAYVCGLSFVEFSQRSVINLRNRSVQGIPVAILLLGKLPKVARNL